MRRRRRLQQPPQQHFIDATTKSFFAVDNHDGDARGVAFSQLRIGVDVDKFRLQAVPLQQFASLVAQVATDSGVDRDLIFGHGGEF